MTINNNTGLTVNTIQTILRYSFYRLLDQIHMCQTSVLELKENCTHKEHQYAIFKKIEMTKTTSFARFAINTIKAILRDLNPKGHLYRLLYQIHIYQTSVLEIKKRK